MPNRLINEKSPYLLQHSDNPVDWFPWGDEAFSIAKNEDKPVFLSIGYSTCHWCHVMEHESFEDQEVADLLNNIFINIKVDREERTDIDHYFMSVCQMLNGSGGWPLTILLTPDKLPFFADTYLPKEDRYMKLGLKSLIEKVDFLWKNRRQEILRSGNQIIEYINKSVIEKAVGDMPEEEIIHTAYLLLEESFDSINGGFGNAPKFPSPHNLLFLLKYWSKFKNKNALDMVTYTLKSMRNGGIFDQIGYGFHRYSTDANWKIPHFEKMLYDQAMISIAYTEAYKITKNNVFRDTAEEILDYVLRELSDKNGGFFSAEDADSEGIEGKFYLWEMKELGNYLEKNEFYIIQRFFNLEENGNINYSNEEYFKGKNIFFINTTPHNKYSENESESTLKTINKVRNRLFLEREKRVHPFKDTKKMTDWNSLMCVAFIMAGKLFANNKYITIAEKTINHIISKFLEKGNIFHLLDDEKIIPGFLDDYAFFSWALFEYYSFSFDLKYLRYFFQINNLLIHHFYDHENGNFYYTSDLHNELLIRKKELYDGAIPSGNSIAIHNLLIQYSISGDEKYFEYLQKSFSSAKNIISNYPAGYSALISDFLHFLNPVPRLIIACKIMDDEIIGKTRFLQETVSSDIPIIIINDFNREHFIEFYPDLQNYDSKNECPTFYLCSGLNCFQPTNDFEKIKAMIQQMEDQHTSFIKIK